MLYNTLMTRTKTGLMKDMTRQSPALRGTGEKCIWHRQSNRTQGARARWAYSSNASSAHFSMSLTVLRSMVRHICRCSSAWKASLRSLALKRPPWNGLAAFTWRRFHRLAPLSGRGNHPIAQM